MFSSVKYLYRSAGLGDVLWTEPLIKQLAAKNRKIILFTHFTELFENYPLQNVVIKKIPSGLKRALLKVCNFFLGNNLYFKLDGVYEANPKMHMLHAYQKFFGLALLNVYPSIFLSSEEKKPFDFLAGKYVVLHLDNATDLNYRKVYGVDWNEIVLFLKKQNFDVILIGKNNYNLENATAFNGNIRELIRLIYHSQFFIGLDSGPSHIAASLQKPSIIFFGSVNPLYRHFTEIFTGIFMQQFCEYAGCYHEVVGGNGQTCKLVGDSGTPKCCVHTTRDVKDNIELLIKKYL